MLTPPIFCCTTFRSAGVSKEATGTDRRRPALPEGRGAAATETGSRNRIPRVKGGIRRNGEEDGQGREEEGRQEALSCLARQRGGGRRPLFPVRRVSADRTAGARRRGSLSASLHRLSVPHAHALDRIALLNPIHDIHPVDDVAECGVSRVEVRLG